MKIIKAFPPNWLTLRKVFPISGRQGIIFAYGDRIYNPSGVPLEEWVLAHEGEHCKRQNAQGVGSWWDAYIANPKFRLEEEVLAHCVEWKTISDYLPPSACERHFARMVERLSSPLYGNLVTKEEAERLISGRTRPRTTD